MLQCKPVNISSSELSLSGGPRNPKSRDINCLLTDFLDLFLLYNSSRFCCFVFYRIEK